MDKQTKTLFGNAMGWRERGSLGMSGDLLEVGVRHLEGKRHDLGNGDFVEAQPFPWSYDDVGELSD